MSRVWGWWGSWQAPSSAKSLSFNPSKGWPAAAASSGLPEEFLQLQKLSEGDGDLLVSRTQTFSSVCEAGEIEAVDPVPLPCRCIRQRSDRCFNRPPGEQKQQSQEPAWLMLCSMLMLPCGKSGASWSCLTRGVEHWTLFLKKCSLKIRGSVPGCCCFPSPISVSLPITQSLNWTHEKFSDSKTTGIHDGTENVDSTKTNNRQLSGTVHEDSLFLV